MKRRIDMQFKIPTNMVFYISIVLAVLGLIGAFVAVPVISALAFWLILAAFVLLALGVTTPGL
jgi:hypothetical protein